MHYGEPLKELSPPKWLFCTEVMYKLDPDTTYQLTSDQKEAQNVLKEAEEAGNEGGIPKATRLYRKAYKLDTSLYSS